MFVKEDTRQLARVVVTDDLKPIQKADRLEIAVVGGWEVVVKKGLYQKGEIAVYLEIDAALPLTSPILTGFDTSYMTIKKDETTGKDYAVIKTLRLRGALSQGLLLEAKYFPGAILNNKNIGQNITNILQVLKYVSPEEAKLYASAASRQAENAELSLWSRWRLKLIKNIVTDGLLPWPRGHIKSDEERVQNCHKLYTEMVDSGAAAEVTVKLNGESATFYTDLDTGTIGVAQRNYSLRTTDVVYSLGESVRLYLSDWMRFIARRFRGGQCSLPVWKKRYAADSVPLVAYFKAGLITERIDEFNKNPLSFAQGKVLAIQGEMLGPDFNGNKENVACTKFFMYRAYLNGSLVCTPNQARAIAAALQISYVPVIDPNYLLPADMKTMLKLADGPAHFNKKIPREGVVVKDVNTSRSFKVISNKWLEQKTKAESAE